MAERTVVIDGGERKMRASALIPRLYRFKFGRDIISDMGKLRKSFETVQNLPEDATDEQREEALRRLCDEIAESADAEKAEDSISEIQKRLSDGTYPGGDLKW